MATVAMECVLLVVDWGLERQKACRLPMGTDTDNLSPTLVSTHDMLNVARGFKKIVKINSYGIASLYRVGEYVAVQDHLSASMEWIVQITGFIVYGPVNNKYVQFYNGIYFAARTLADGSINIDDLCTY